MHATIPGFRALFHALEEHSGDSAYDAVLQPWLPKAQQAMAVLSRYGDPAARTWARGEPDLCNGGNSQFYSCLEHLYALSRVNDLLLLSFEPDRLGRQAANRESWAEVSAEEYLAWWQALGMTQIARAQPFHPFFHEIVTVEQAEDPSEPIQVTQTLWPGLLLGSMLFSRAGVVVRGGSEHIVKEIAETSLLYWTYERNNRRATDASHGWGHNSQWATDFRRDYVTDEAYYYNVDGMTPLFDADGRLDQAAADEHLTPQGAIEIMTHRCLISTPEDEKSGIVFLDDHTYQEPRVK